MFRQVMLPPEIRGVLYLHSMPGRYEPFSASPAEIEDKDITAVICLTSLKEIEEKSPEYAAAITAGALPFERVAFPIRDFNVPDDKTAFIALAKTVAGRLLAGENILVHCAGGIGRTGTFAISVLLALHIDMDEAFNTVEIAGSGPETNVQHNLIAEIADRLS